MTAVARPLLRLVSMTMLTAILALSMTTTGCKDEKKITVPIVNPYAAQSSAVNVLANLKTAYEARNIEEYLKLFSSDFIFVFNPADVNHPTDPTPPQWGLAQERTSTNNMFSDHRVDTITLEFQEKPLEPDSAAHGAGTWKMKVYEAFLQVNTRNEQDELLTYQVPGTTQMFYFREVPEVLASDGKPTWYIYLWQDEPIGVRKTVEWNWGAIKNIYW
jgi:hypothetical protein